MVKKIYESNKQSLNKPLDTDIAYYSELNEWQTDNAFRSFSVKFAINQSIYYKIDGKEHEVKNNQYMLACKQSDAMAYFQNKLLVKSICIDICPLTIAESFTVLTSKNEDFDSYLSGYFKYPEFFESVNSTHNNSIGTQLQNLFYSIQRENDFALNKEWFMDLSEKIIFQEYGNYLSLNGIDSIKPATKKEVM